MSLPAERIDAQGRSHVDWGEVARLALPLMASSAGQLVLNLTDLFFIGRISTRALAAVSAIHWLIVMLAVGLGGVAIAVQTVAAQAYGAGRRNRASQSVWTALWGALFTAPVFVLIAFAGAAALAHLGMAADVEALARAFWVPRVSGLALGVGVYALFGFFNGIGRPTVTWVVTAVMAVGNAVLNQWFIFGLGWGIAGAASATNAAQALGLAVALTLFLSPERRRRFRTHLTWRLHWSRLAWQSRFGLPMGLLWAADMFGFSVFQLMQVHLSVADGAATQLVMILTAVAYLPGVGIAMAGTTLVGQSIGAGAREWAFRLGNRIIAAAAAYMGGTGVLLAAAGPWLLPWFVHPGDPGAGAVLALATRLLWLAAIYQLFDGLNLGSSFCLRGAGDARIPAMLVIVVSWGLFVPLAHALTFGPGQGWYTGLPLWGRGAIGGWCAVVIYICVLGCTLAWRWRSRVWMRMRIG